VTTGTVAVPVTLRAVSAADDDFRAFYTREYAGLARYLWRLVDDLELSHDLAQESMVRLYSRWRGVTEPRGYLYKVATNLARRAWRKRADEVIAVAGLAQLARVVGATVEGPELTSAVRDAVRSLPARLRDVILLHYFADLTVEDVASATSRPAGSVKRQLSEARAALAVALAEAPRTPGGSL
jgi:RNA polymerase sigma-70 factor (ECF subfamily)